MDYQNVKFIPGKYYAKNNWDKEIEIVGTVAGTAICQGWKISYEPIRIDESGNEFIRIESLIYPAYYRLN